MDRYLLKRYSNEISEIAWDAMGIVLSLMVLAIIACGIIAILILVICGGLNIFGVAR